MGTKASGNFLGVGPNWFKGFTVDRDALKGIFAQVRQEASETGCKHFPGRDDVATNRVLFENIVDRYEKSIGKSIPSERYPEFRRWILLLFKGGDMP